MRVLPRAVAAAAILGAVVLAAAPSGAQSPTPSASAIPYATPGSGGLTPGIFDWQPVSSPPLREDRWLGPLVSWAGGFALIEHRRPSRRADYRPRFIWHSPDGQAWDRSRLPRAMIGVRDLLAYRDGLLIVTNERRDWRHHGFALGFWRSPDGVRWRKAGGLAYQVPKRLERLNCQANRQQVTTVADRITVYVTMCWDPCCGMLPIGSRGDAVAVLGSWISGHVTARGVAAWSSTDGERWRRQPLKGMAPPGTDDYGIVIKQYPDELLALLLAQEPAVLRSVDGITWSTYGQVPESLDWYGNLQLAPLPDGLLLVAETYESPPGYGNQMIGWRMTPSDTTQVFTRRAAFAEWVVPMTDQVLLMGGRSWGKGPDGIVSNDDNHDDQEWVWMLGTSDGGLTWPETSSWTGADRSCFGSVVRNEDTLVGLACAESRGRRTEIPPGTPAIWTASMDDLPSVPEASPGPFAGSVAPSAAPSAS